MSMWSFAVQHACEMLRCRKLRLAGDKKVPQCWPFGTYVALRIPGDSKGFHPFETRGCQKTVVWVGCSGKM
eukprot:6459857-Amphidinium_carterae.2